MSDRVAVFNNGRIEQVGTPLEVYERPTTEFVAGFVGVSNLVELDGLPVMIRPEKIWFVTDGEPDPEGTQVEAGAIEETAYIGMVTRYLVALDNGDHMSVVRQNLHADRDGGESDAIGRRVRIAFRNDQAYPIESAPESGDGPDDKRGQK